MQLTGAQIIIECLKEQRIDTVFGYPGGTILSVYDALYNRGEGIRHVLTSHEQGAAHAADGYARATGKTGVCMVTSGPGATNLVTGIATAYMDSSSVVAITINVPVENLGKDSFQEIDIAGITMPVTKHNFIVKDIKALAETMRRAFRIARSGRPGPVLVDIAKDVTELTCEYEPSEEQLVGPLVSAGDATVDKSIEKTCRLLAKAKRPLLLVGGGTVRAHADKSLRDFVSRTSIPVCDTMMGKGAMDSTSPMYLGMAGEYGTALASYAIDKADLIIAVGCRFSDRLLKEDGSFAPSAKLIHVDIDKAELNKNVESFLAINTDADYFFGKLCENMEHRGVSPDFSAAVKHIREAVGSPQETIFADTEELTGESIAAVTYESFGSDAIYVTEVGRNQICAVNTVGFTRSGQLITSGGLGTMGFGLGAAIGAAVGESDRRVVNFAGDGCFRMNMNELMTAVSNGLNITEIIFDNGRLGMVHDMQEKDFDGRYIATELDTRFNYAGIAAAMGACAYECKTNGELRKALHEIESKAPCVNVIVCHL